MVGLGRLAFKGSGQAEAIPQGRAGQKETAGHFVLRAAEECWFMRNVLTLLHCYRLSIPADGSWILYPKTFYVKSLWSVQITV